MPESNATPEQREFDDIAAELYSLRPEAFAARRDNEVRKARAEKQQPLARELGLLRRPTQTAWIINLLWRAQRPLVEQYLKLSDDLSQAQAQGAVPELQRLTARRRELEDALIDHARKLAQEVDAPLTGGTEREIRETLTAALAIPEVADEVRSGRLLKATSYAGFGTAPEAAPAPRTRAPETPERQQPATRSTQPPPTTRHEMPAARREAEDREEAKRRIENARATVQAAAAALAEQEQALQVASERREALAKQAEQLSKQLRQVRQEAEAADRDLPAARRRRDEAKKAHDAALRALERAERHG